MEGENEIRGSIENPSVPLGEGLDALIAGLGESMSGRAVSADSALKYHAVYRAVNLISKDIAKINVFIYKRGDEGKERATDHPAYKLIRNKPNSFMNKFNWFHTLTAHSQLTGNGYAFIDRDNRGRPLELIPLDPQQITIIREGGRILYWLRNINRKVDSRNMIHIKPFTWDGITGLSPVQYAKENFGLGLAGTDYQNVFFRNNGKPSSVLQHPGRLTEDVVSRLRKQWQNAHSGVENAHKVAILEEGMELKPYSINPKDAQVLELLQDNIRAVANIFNLPPHKLGDTTRTSFSSLEQENQSYLDDALDPILVNWEQELSDKLLTDQERDADSHFIEFERKALLRADLAATGAYLTQALGGHPWITVNEARDMQNLNKLQGFDSVMVPTNNFGQDIDTDPESTHEPEPERAKPQTDTIHRTLQESLTLTLANESRRMWRRLTGRTTREAGKKKPDWHKWQQEHRIEFKETLAPIANGLGALTSTDPSILQSDWVDILFSQFDNVVKGVRDKTSENLEKRLIESEHAAIQAVTGV